MYVRKKNMIKLLSFPYPLCIIIYCNRQMTRTEADPVYRANDYFFNQGCFCSLVHFFARFITIEVILNICDWDIFIGLRTEHRYLCYLLRLSTLNVFKYDGLEHINSLNTQQINNILSCSASEKSVWAQYRLVQSFVYVLSCGWLLFYLELTLFIKAFI